MLKQIALGIVLLAGLQVGSAWADEALNKALMYAALYGNWSKLESLLSEGADVNTKNENGNTALYILANGASKKFVVPLISKGADVNTKNENGDTPLHSASSGNNKEVAELLIAKGANVNAKDNKGYTPLHYAAKKEVAELLVSKGADVNAKDNNGGTPLHYAAFVGREEVVEFFISKGVDVNVKDNNGSTPLYYARTNEKKEVAELLQSALQKQDEMQEEIAVLLKSALQNKTGNQREAFNRVTVYYKGRVMSDAIRHPFIALAVKLKPAPAVPEEARKYLVRGNALLQDAKYPGEARAAIQEYQNALLAAPWWGDAYYNLSKAQELAGDLDGAVSSMQYYLLTEPQDKRETQDRLYAIEAKRDKAKGK